MSGTIYLVLKVTDSSGATNATSIGSITAAAPFTDLAPVSVTPAARAKPNGKLAVAIVVEQNGNVPLKADVPVELAMSLQDLLSISQAQPVGTPTARLVIHPGKKATLHLTVTLSSATTPGTYHVIADLDPANTLGDTDPSNNTAGSAKTVVVT